MEIWLIIALSSALFGSMCHSHTVHLGRSCPEVNALPNLSVNKILGEWFVAYQFDTSNTCLIWKLTKPNRDLDELQVVETRQLQFLDTVGVDHKHSVTGNIDIPNPEIPSKMRIRWLTSLTGKADFIVFDTDYENYLAIFQCDRAGFIHRRDVTVLSRTKTIDDMFIARIRRLLNTAGIEGTHLNQINHDLCRNETKRDWHIDGELFGLLPNSRNSQVNDKLGQDIKNIDISELEIVEGLSQLSENIKKGDNERTPHI